MQKIHFCWISAALLVASMSSCTKSKIEAVITGASFGQKKQLKIIAEGSGSAAEIGDASIEVGN
ncbi:MAG TPA: hypothetical protein VHO68_03415, partial [Bacteroidales bacterium]|nr:hypothetical protein [Bacteroidales bacterium]